MNYQNSNPYEDNDMKTFEELTRDPLHPTRFKSEFDSGDHLHPGDRGNKAMADAINLDALFQAD